MTGNAAQPRLFTSLSEFFLKGNRMRALLFVGILVGFLGLAGCATMTRTPADVRATYSRSAQYDMRQMADDFNFIWMLDRPTRLSKWVMR